MSIPALLQGVSSYLAAKLTAGIVDVNVRAAEAKKVQPRYGADGAPLGAWKTGMHWFIGVYFGGANGGARESYGLRMTVGIDITRMIPEAPSGLARTELLMAEDEFFDLTGRVSELMLGGRSLISNACNAALAGTWQADKGSFHENFESITISQPKTPGPEWCLKKGSSAVGNIVVESLQCREIVWRKLFANLYGES